MYAVELNRDAFVDLLGYRRSKEPKAIKNESDLLSRKTHDAGIIAIWEDKPSDNYELPQVFVVADQELEEFMAYTATYVGTFFPFTAFFRVMSHTELVRFVDRKKNGRRNTMPRAPYIGMIISEAFTQAANRLESIEKLSIQACLSTLSSPIAQAFSADYELASAAAIGERWIAVREMLGQKRSALSVDPSDSGFVWQILIAFHDSDINALSALDKESERQGKIIADELNNYISNRRLSKAFFKEIGDDYKEVDEALGKMEGSKEDSVRVFQSVAEYLISTKSSQGKLREFAAAYLMGRIGAGSIRYLPLATSVSKAFPAAPIWFGFLTGLHEKSDVLTSSNCLGRRLIRYIFRPYGLFSDPDRDISFAEFFLLHNKEQREIGFRTEHVSQLSVELVPNVIGQFRAVAEGRETTVLKNEERSDRNIDELSYLLDQAGSLLRKMRKNSQKELFDDKYEASDRGRYYKKPTGKRK